MTVTMNRNDTQLTVNIRGRLDTLTAPELEEKLEDALDGVEELILDLDGLEYISSAGLRVILSVIKQMDEQGEMKLRNVCDDVMDVFEVTGFIDFLNIEE
ncbi:MAG: STAS domain-containing protein [Ruminococcus sp.]|nr:STAS domain-containing protein [Ruminococcus sp.]